MVGGVKGFDERRFRISSGCGVVGVIDREGRPFSGELVVSSLCVLSERGNGLGSGFAGYGIYPDLKDCFCFHVMYYGTEVKELLEGYLREHFEMVFFEPIPTKEVKGLGPLPLLWRYFLKCKEDQGSEEEEILRHVMFINRRFRKACVFSSGKNMGVFKGVGEPEAIAEFYRIPDYQGYIWIGHTRFPTNTPGWWGGAHPFNVLDLAVVHNGELSSYGANRRYLESWGYQCTLLTDTEVIAYLFDLLYRKHKLDLDLVVKVLSPPFWFQIQEAENGEKELLRSLRIIYGGALLNGPFSVIVASSNWIVGLNDRMKLRPLVAAKSGDFLYLASEEAAIRAICPTPEEVWRPGAFEPVIGRVRDGQT